MGSATDIHPGHHAICNQEVCVVVSFGQPTMDVLAVAKAITGKVLAEDINSVLTHVQIVVADQYDCIASLCTCCGINSFAAWIALGACAR